MSSPSFTTSEPPPAAEWNWARTYQFSPSGIERPATLGALQSILAAAAGSGQTVRCVGSRHSFTGIADGDVIVDLTALPERFELRDDHESATVSASMIYSRLAELLQPAGLAVANLASLPHITIGGATATATHGSGDRNGNLATSIRAVELITGDGEMRRIDRTNPAFGAAAVSLGALGILTAIELELVPSFEVRQLVYNDLSWDALLGNFDAIVGSAYSVSVFTDWVNHLQLWTKARTDQVQPDHAALHDGVRATEPQHPVPGESAHACTQQGLTPGTWNERLPHFRAGAVPSVGAEVQSEFFVDRCHAVDAIAALRTIGSQMAPHLMASEIRTVRADDLWLSPQYQRDCVGFHFTWQHDTDSALAMARLLGSTLAPFDSLPHWGKVFDAAQFDFAAIYPRLPDALRAFQDADPVGRFRNAWLLNTLA